MMPFPLEAPYRVDQVMAAPALMTGLWSGLVVIAVLLSWADRLGRQRCWWFACGLFLLVTGLFFTLASWGTSDVTKLNHFYITIPQRLPLSEPLWPLLTPLVLALPYRMAAVHGLVAAGYAAVPLVLARHRHLGAWAGWWALLILCSPLHRSFLQNGITRQALAVLLLVPLMLRCSGVLLGRWRLLLGSTLLSSLCHTTFPISLWASLLPALVRLRPTAGWRARLRSRWTRLLGQAPAWAKGLGLGLGALLAALPLLVVLPGAMRKVQDYSLRETFFSSYPIHPDVLRLELALLLAVAAVILRRALDPIALLRRDGLTRQMLAYGVLLVLIQCSVAREWLAPLTFRLTDLVGLYLLLSFLLWISQQQAAWAVLPPLAISVAGWLQHRLLDFAELQCGLNDNFLCIPDRLPWLIRY